MANTIDTAFIKQFESEVHLAYQRMGSKLMNTVRNVSNVAGSVVRFQKIGTGSASTKSRNGMITPMELAHTTVEATLADYYAAEYIDKLDELKTNIDERQAQLNYMIQVQPLKKLICYLHLKRLVPQTYLKMVEDLSL